MFELMRSLPIAIGLTVGCLLAGAASGCGQANSQPLPKVTTVIGTSSPCAACDKKISNVTQDNVFTYKGVQYVVCDESCAAEIREWIDTLDE